MAANVFFTIKQNGSWGLADICGHVIIPCQYREFDIYEKYARAYPWNGNNGIEWRMDELVVMRDKKLKEEKAAEEKVRREKEQRIAREKKEKELVGQHIPVHPCVFRNADGAVAHPCAL